MSAKELKRKTVFERVARGEMTLAGASRILELSYRQCLRVYARFKSTEDKELVHKSRGQPSGRGKAADFKEKVIPLPGTLLWPWPHAGGGKAMRGRSGSGP